jgi:cytochrome P450
VLAGRAPTVADLPNLPYTDMLVREVLRLYPPAPGVAREPIEDVEIGGYVVPKGSLVTVNTYALQRDRRFFEDPERFDPGDLRAAGKNASRATRICRLAAARASASATASR